MAVILAKIEAKWVREKLGYVEEDALVVTLPDTLSEVVAKTTADTLNCVECRSKQKVTLLQE